MRIRNLNLIDARKKEAKSGEPRPRRLESEPSLKEARVGLDTSQPRSPNRISTAHSLLSAAYSQNWIPKLPKSVSVC